MRKIISVFITAFWLLTNVSAQNPAIQNMVDAVDLDALKYTVRSLSGEIPVEINGITDTIFSRHYLQPGNEKAFQWLKAGLQELGYEIDSMNFRVAGKNLFAKKVGTQRPKQFVMLGAHYDCNPSGLIAPGADDNASGVAAVLEAARIMKDESFPYTIVFALWDEEEIGLIGSSAYVPSIGADNDTLLGYVNLDMIGWDGNDDGIVEINVRNIAQSVALGDLAVKCNTDYSIGLVPKVINPGPGSTDFATFWNGGHTAMGINEVYYDVDNYPYYHTTADSLGQFNLEYFLKCTKLALATVAELATETSISLNAKDYFVQSREMVVYPNPAKDVFYLRLNNAVNEIQTIRILDVSGQVQMELRNVPLTTSVPVQNLASGIYIIQIETDRAVFVEKVLKL